MLAITPQIHVEKVKRYSPPLYSKKYPKDKKYVQNWLDINIVAYKSRAYRSEIVESIISKLSTAPDPNVSITITRIYRLRLKAIILAFFSANDRENYSKYLEPVFPVDFYWDTTPEEFEIIDHFCKCINIYENGLLEQGHKRFIEADKLFGKLRYDEWLKNEN